VVGGRLDHLGRLAAARTAAQERSADLATALAARQAADPDTLEWENNTLLRGLVELPVVLNALARN